MGGQTGMDRDERSNRDIQVKLPRMIASCEEEACMQWGVSVERSWG